MQEEYKERITVTRFIDISVTLRAGIASDPPVSRPEIEYLDHVQTAPRMANAMGIQVEQLPEGKYAAGEMCRISTHHGTHVDAPWHYWPSSNHELAPGGEAAARIDELPLEWFFQPGVKLDFRHFPDGYVATAADVQAELARIGHTLKPLEIVVVNTAAGLRYGEDDYVDRGCGMGRDATLWLVRQGVRVVGTDGWSWDAPFKFTRERVQETGNLDLIWEGHRVGKDIGYSQIEKLHNLEQLPADGFQVSCFPVKVYQASAGWTRAVAILPN
jgi:kynurenine formamidase